MYDGLSEIIETPAVNKLAQCHGAESYISTRPMMYDGYTNVAHNI